MKITSLLILLLSIMSCNRTGSPMVQNAVDSLKQRPLKQIDRLTDRPTKAFGLLVQRLDSAGYRSDTTRVKKLKNYRELIDCEVRPFGGFVFYKLNKEKTTILWWNSKAHETRDSIDTEIFREAKNVWGYFYREERRQGLVPDGVIEQWEFADAGIAQNAMNKLAAIYPLPYFNTQPYYITKGQFLFIFHTRASAFSYKQREFFNIFKEVSSAPDNGY